MSNPVQDALAKIAEGFGELAGLVSDGDEAEAPAKSTPASKKTTSKKKTRSKKKATAKKSDGPSIDEVRAKCLELVEAIDEDEDGEEDGNDVFLEILAEVDEDAKLLSELEGNGPKLKALLAAVQSYMDENFSEEEED